MKHNVVVRQSAPCLHANDQARSATHIPVEYSQGHYGEGHSDHCGTLQKPWICRTDWQTDRVGGSNKFQRHGSYATCDIGILWISSNDKIRIPYWRPLSFVGNNGWHLIYHPDSWISAQHRRQIFTIDAEGPSGNAKAASAKTNLRFHGENSDHSEIFIMKMCLNPTSNFSWWDIMTSLQNIWTVEIVEGDKLRVTWGEELLIVLKS